MLARVSVKRRNSIVVAAIEGEIDVSNSADIGRQLFDAAPNDAAGLIVDLSPTTYLDSRGVQLLIELAERLRRREQQIRVVAPQHSVVRRILVLTRLDALIPLDSTSDNAVSEMEQKL